MQLFRLFLLTWKIVGFAFKQPMDRYLYLYLYLAAVPFVGLRSLWLRCNLLVVVICLTRHSHIYLTGGITKMLLLERRGNFEAVGQLEAAAVCGDNGTNVERNNLA